jgi:deazaflavin-dependent oxidoreductase (nitroreductase family)
VSEATTHLPPVRGLTRCLLRAPVALYRWRLGWLLGDRFLLLTHTGRRTGQLRQTVLEVVDHDQKTDRYIVASGWGHRSDWFQNVQRHPTVRVQVGRRSFPAEARALAAEEAVAALASYADRHPLAFRLLARVISGTAVSGRALQTAQLAQTLPLVAFDHLDRHGEPGGPDHGVARTKPGPG